MYACLREALQDIQEYSTAHKSLRVALATTQCSPHLLLILGPENQQIPRPFFKSTQPHRFYVGQPCLAALGCSAHGICQTSVYTGVTAPSDSSLLECVETCETRRITCHTQGSVVEEDIVWYVPGARKLHGHTRHSFWSLSSSTSKHTLICPQ